MRFAYGLANAVSTANICRMDEGDEFHSGGTAPGMVRIRKLYRFALQKPYRVRKAGASEGDGTATGSHHWQNAWIFRMGTAICHFTASCFDEPRFRELRLVGRCHFHPVVRAPSLMRTPSVAQQCGCGLLEFPVEQLFKPADPVVSVASIDVSGTFRDGPVRSARF